MNFGEKQKEYSPKHGKDLPVWQSPKYQESKAKAEEIINSGKYGVDEGDFWLLMNVTKSEKMAYTGLIISHNGCLKINDCLESKFDPACVSIDKDGYKGSLVYTYCNPAQGIYEVGEVSGSNCKNEYPYAMAFKRLFDRVVLKLSKLAYAGIYSDSEADEFAQRLDGGETPEESKKRAQNGQKTAQGHSGGKSYGHPSEGGNAGNFPVRVCERCGQPIKAVRHGGKEYSPEEIAANAKITYEQELCWDCMKALNAEKQAGEVNENAG